MKKILLAGIFLVLGTLALSAQNLPTIRIVNNTGYPIYGLFVSPASSDVWGEELLGEEILEDGQTITYRLPQPLNQENKYDIMLVDEDEDCYKKWNLTLTNNARIVFTMDDLDAIEDD
ncbi:MAG: hypothetical protein LBH07_08315 [Treponema sp.]|jgi:hypothetical protein|nr:hypothetical protein [Treponema sp.]